MLTRMAMHAPGARGGKPELPHGTMLVSAPLHVSQEIANAFRLLKISEKQIRKLLGSLATGTDELGFEQFRDLVLPRQRSKKLDLHMGLLAAKSGQPVRVPARPLPNPLRLCLLGPSCASLCACEHGPGCSPAYEARLLGAYHRPVRCRPASRLSCMRCA